MSTDGPQARPAPPPRAEFVLPNVQEWVRSVLAVQAGSSSSIVAGIRVVDATIAAEAAAGTALAHHKGPGACGCVGEELPHHVPADFAASLTWHYAALKLSVCQVSALFSPGTIESPHTAGTTFSPTACAYRELTGMWGARCQWPWLRGRMQRSLTDVCLHPPHPTLPACRSSPASTRWPL